MVRILTLTRTGEWNWMLQEGDKVLHCWNYGEAGGPASAMFKVASLYPGCAVILA